MKHRSAIYDLREDFGVRRVDKRSCTIHPSRCIADPEFDGRASKGHCRLPSGPILYDGSSKCFDDCTYRDGGPSILDDGWRVKSPGGAVDREQGLLYLKDDDGLLLLFLKCCPNGMV